MKNYLFLLIAALSVWGCMQNLSGNARIGSLTPQEDQKPNVIVIVVDDAGYADFGFMGSKDLETPQIDSLARQGVIFTDAHVTATVCAPSRAGLLTGQY